MSTGSDLVRAALKTKNRRVNLSSMARDLNMTTSVLEDYAESRIQTLPPDVIEKVVGYLWPNGGTKLDLERDLLVAIDKVEPKPLGRPPEPCARTEERYVSGEGFTRSTPLPPMHAAKEVKKSGWLGFFSQGG